MRLLDHVAQCSAEFVIRENSGVVWRLTGAGDYAQAVARCPLRYVLADELVRACIELGYSGGAGLAGCIDLVHLPAEQCWIEWDGEVQQEELIRLLPEWERPESVSTLRHGVLVCGSASGRVGTFRSFWLPHAEPREPVLGPIETYVDLDAEASSVSSPDALFEGEAVSVRDPHNAQVDRLLRCATFRFDPVWQKYYGSMAKSAALRAEVSRFSLTPAFDIPMLLALFLLMAFRAPLVESPVKPDRLNQKRVRRGRHPLLPHIEVSCPVFASEKGLRAAQDSHALKTGPRMHHVRGHIVRRQGVVFWRRSHWRGHLRLGSVRSRTVTLRLPTTA